MRALTKTFLGLGVLPALALASCTTGETVAAGRPAAVLVGNGGRAIYMGTAIAAMAPDYSQPHPGIAGTGASAWVPPSPPPAYVDTSPGPAPVAEGPPPAAVRNRQPGANAAAAASADEIPRPEAAAPTPAQAAATVPARPVATARAQAAAASPVDIAKGRKLFADMGCGGCHTLADAGAGGGIGPGLDNNPRLSPDYVFQTVHDGRGGMPSFGGQLSDADIHALARYIVQVSKK